MRKDYHIHPTIIQHPERFDAYVQQALAKGIQEICVTDHMPISVSNAPDRIPDGMVKNYCSKVRELARRYEGIISVKCGIEVDYHPSAMAEIKAVLDDGEFDYILGSSHMHLFYGEMEKHTWNEFAHSALENVLMAVESGLFDAVPHLDMYRWVFGLPQRFPLIRDEYTAEKHIKLIDQILTGIGETGMYLEINPHLAERDNDINRVYPEKCIVEKALEKGVRFCYGSDAHAPASVGAMLDQLREDPVYGKALAGWEADGRSES